MKPLERALRELEIATAAAARISLQDVERARAIFKRRSSAIAELAGLRDSVLSLPAAELQEVVSRLQSAAKAGEEARHGLARSKGSVTAEWSRWNQIRRALGPVGRAGANKIDCRG